MHFFIIPTNSCNSSCKYCFSRNKTEPTLPLEILNKAIVLFNNLANNCNENNINITFHGGEPLLAGVHFYEDALSSIKKAFIKNVIFSIQTNLWDINSDFCKLFEQYNVRVGTSLDGSEEINDHQRSYCYFKRTMGGIEYLHKHDIPTGCIATFTTYSGSRCKEVFNFFLENNIPFEIHSAVKPLGFNGDNYLFLKPKEFGELLINILDIYLPNAHRLKIGTLDTLIKNVSNDKSGLCTFTKCLGNYLAVDPIGDLYTCNRFVGKKDFCVGNAKTVNSWKDIKNSQAWHKLENWQKIIDIECADCIHKNICHGGCMYAGFASGNGKPLRDPNCEAYKLIYKYILDKGTEELFSNDNLIAVTKNNSLNKNNSSLLRKGALLQIMNNDPHPYDIARLSKKIIASVLLGITDRTDRVSEILFSLNVIKSKEEASVVIEKLRKKLINPANGFVNLYLHITGTCNLHCSHCYAYSHKEIKAEHLPLNNIVTSIKDALELGFKKIIITGGEPLLYPDFKGLLDFLLKFKKTHKLPQIVLRTNLSTHIDDITLEKISQVFDQITISIDGSENIHDSRRGKGTYRQTINNLQRFDKRTLEDKVTLSTVLNSQTFSEQTILNIKQHIISLKEKYQLKDICFLPILPIGRAADIKVRRPEVESISVVDWISKGYSTRASCGLGYNLMIDSNGSAYPCHVYKSDTFYLNNILKTNLHEIVKKDNFINLRLINVNNINKCNKCCFRYLCGGICAVWQDDKCEDLYLRAESLFLEALENLDISIENFHKHGVDLKSFMDDKI